jgi:hypothetical protein
MCVYLTAARLATKIGLKKADYWEFIHNTLFWDSTLSNSSPPPPSPLKSVCILYSTVSTVQYSKYSKINALENLN